MLYISTREGSNPAVSQSATLQNEPPKSRRERRREEIHDRLLDAAVTLFERKGFEATTVNEICDRADLAQKTFFNHFPTKQRVIREIAERFLDQMSELVEEARLQPGSTSDRLTHLFDRAGEEAMRAGPRHKELLSEVSRVAMADGSAPETKRQLHTSLHTLLEDGARAGELTDAHDVEFLVEMVAGAFSSVLLTWTGAENYPLRENLRETARFLSRAISRSD